MTLKLHIVTSSHAQVDGHHTFIETEKSRHNVKTPGIDPVHYAWYGRVTVALRLY